MKYPQRVQEIVQALYALNLPLAEGNEDNRRALTLKICQQVRFELGEKWGTKSADPGRPPSKDSIAWVGPDQLHAWDWQNGSTRKPNIFPEESPLEEVKTQNFIPVDPVDHLKSGGTEIPPPPPPPPPDPSVKILLEQLLQRTAALEGQVDTLLKVLKSAFEGLEAADERRYKDIVAHFGALAAPEFPVYDGSIGGFARVTLNPRKKVQ